MDYSLSNLLHVLQAMRTNNYHQEHWGGSMTVSFSKYLPWQAMHFLQRSTHFSKT
jgi:hypothetical protein